MASIKHIVRKLQRKNSKSYVFFLAVLLMICFCGALAARYYVFEPLLLANKSMAPRYKENSLLWVCKLPQCIDKININETVWAKLRNQETIVRKIIGMPGDSLSISDEGRVKSNRLKFRWRNENAFIESRSFYIPKKGDTLYFSQLNDVEQDYIISYLHGQGTTIVVKTTLWQGNHELSTDRIGATKIGNRQVSLHEIDFLPWQDRYLIELQIRQSEPGTSPIKMKRELFLAKKKEPPKPKALPTDTTSADTTAADSSVTDSIHVVEVDSAATNVPMDSSAKNNTIETAATDSSSAKKDTADVDTTAISGNIESKEKPELEIIAPLDTIIIEKDCYYLACEKGNNCLDSRELGYFTKKDIIGRNEEWPTRMSAIVASKLSIVQKELLFQKNKAQKFGGEKFDKVKNKAEKMKAKISEKISSMKSAKDEELPADNKTSAGEKTSADKKTSADRKASASEKTSADEAGKKSNATKIKPVKAPERIPASRIKSDSGK